MVGMVIMRPCEVWAMAAVMAMLLCAFVQAQMQATDAAMLAYAAAAPLLLAATLARRRRTPTPTTTSPNPSLTTAAKFAGVSVPMREAAAATAGRAGGARTVARAMPEAEALAEVARAAVAVPTLYGLMSANEYVTHRYYQHAEFNSSQTVQNISQFLTGKPAPKVDGGGHVEHHKETLDDMLLKEDERWRNTRAAKKLDADTYRGTAFTWTTSFIMLLQMLPSTLPIFHLLGYSVPETMVFLLPGMLLHALVWNALHPNMHGLPDVPITEGAPSSWMAGLRDSAYFKWIYQNHEGHHVAGGKANYNVACPGVDHLVGSYVPEEVWRPNVRTSYATWHAQDDNNNLDTRSNVSSEPGVAF